MPKRIDCTKVESVVFNGIVYRRYPSGNSTSDRNYFRCGSSDIKRGYSYLHRDIWKAQYGEMPEGCIVHHKDGNPANNTMENLELVSSAEHGKLHPMSDKHHAANKKHLAEIRHLASEWHRSEEGHKWHSEHGKSAWAKRKLSSYVCQHCGNPYQSKSKHGNERFCSDACKSYARKASGVDNEERICEQCGQPFKCNRYGKNRFCDRSCAASYNNSYRKT